MNCFECKISGCEYSNSLGYCVREAGKEVIAKAYAEKLELANPQTEAFDFEGAVMYGYEKAIEKIKEIIQSYVEKQMTCKWLRNGDECGKGLPGTPCEIVGCVAWEHYEPADAMKLLEEKIKLVSDKKTWEGVDVESFLAEIRGENTELYKAASDLVDAVERYTKPEKGQFCHRSELLNIKDRLKKLISNV